MTTLFDDKQEAVITGGLIDRVTPRPYQRDALQSFVRQYQDGRRSFLMRLATGCGKTLTACLLMDWWRSLGDNYRVVVICYERILVEQFSAEIQEWLPWEKIGLEMASDGWISSNPSRQEGIVVASRQTLTGNGRSFDRLDKFSNEYNWLVVLDELQGWSAKLRTCGPIIEHFERNPNSVRVGLTATPQRGDGVSLKRIAEHPISDLRLGKAIEGGWLVPFRQKYVTVEGVDFKNLKVVAGDFTDAELDDVLSQRKAVMSMVGPLLELVEGRRCLVFCPGVHNAKVVADTISAEVALRPTESAWGGAEYMHGGTETLERRGIISRFQRDEFQFLCVCGLCRAGYNDRGLGAVAVFRPTKSRVLAEQMKGRAVRTLPGVIDGFDTAEERREAIRQSAKPDALVIDLVGVSGMPEVATTAQLYLEGIDDELLKRIDAILGKGEIDNIDDAKKQAESDIKRETEERRRRERKEAERLAQIKVEVAYQVRQKELDSFLAPSRVIDRTQWASDAQVEALMRYGVPRHKARAMSKKQAGAVLSKYKAEGKRPVGPPRGEPVSGNDLTDWIGF